LPRITILRIIISINHRSMIAQIQTYFSHFLTKLVALALFLFILTSFNLQVITANAQAGSAPATNTGSTAGKNIITQKDVDSRIGSLKNCSVDSPTANPEKLKTDPNAANEFIFKCLKDIIQIVITISIILAVMRMIFVGIQYLNTFGDDSKLNAELSKAITGFVAGAVILGLFATIIQVINPSALKIDKIFSAQVIADYKCLNKGIGDVKGVKTVGTKGCANNSQGSGPTTSDNSTSISTLFGLENPTEEQKKEQKRIVDQSVDCLKSVAFASSSEFNNCKPYLEALSVKDNKILGQLNSSSGSNVDAVFQNEYNTDTFANGTYTVLTNDKDNVTVKYVQTGTTKEQKFTLFYNDDCEKTPFDSGNIKEVKAGGQINFAPCILQITKDR
jgi:hypothetical protein